MILFIKYNNLRHSVDCRRTKAPRTGCAYAVPQYTGIPGCSHSLWHTEFVAGFVSIQFPRKFIYRFNSYRLFLVRVLFMLAQAFVRGIRSSVRRSPPRERHSFFGHTQNISYKTTGIHQCIALNIVNLGYLHTYNQINMYI